MPTANSSASKEAVTAALLVIGSKILSGRTRDQNVGYIAEYLTAVSASISRKCGWSAMRRARSSTHSMRCGIAAPVMSVFMGSFHAESHLHGRRVTSHERCEPSEVRQISANFC